ncbi:MAG: DUF362 domain-containing protein, partial [Desulfovibrio sp.]|nr:DUF362 domain-containing protein [Desulfovibrio sp.]
KLNLRCGQKVLVKPNLLRADPLSCTDPRVVAATCRYLLDHKVTVQVADSPGFGLAKKVAKTVGLTSALAPLGLTLTDMGPVRLCLVEVCGQRLALPLAELALNCDLLLSVPKVKAHSQFGLTLGVKNCFGCVPGLRKAFLHTKLGQKEELFAGAIAALLQVLPPVAEVSDGVVAMHVTGPSGGRPYQLGIVGASASAVALDKALTEILGVCFESLPLGRALNARYGKAITNLHITYPLASPKDLAVPDFVVPKHLLTMSFAPHRLLISCFKRLWAAWRG